MTRFLVFVLLTAMTALGTQISSPSVPSDPVSVVTFNKDVAPILQKNCQVCHRPGEVGPMSFLTYESTRPWAKAIKSAVITRKMPPWFADPHYGDFRNAPKLTQEDIDTLASWADTGAREGDAKDKLLAMQWASGWRIQPDVIVSMPAPYHIRAKGDGEIKEFLVPSPFQGDTWISSIEIRPGDPSVVHHVIVQVPEVAGGKFAWGATPPFKQGARILQEGVLGTGDQNTGLRGPRNPGSYGDRQAERITGVGSFTTMEAVYAPESPPMDFRYHDSAKLIRGGKQIRIEVHYTPNGKETLDQTMVGFTLAGGPAKRRFVMMAPSSLTEGERPIPAGNPNWESRGELTFNQDAELVWFMPHMHLRGKDMTFRLIYPNGRTDTVLRARFNFQWQLGYEVEDPIKVTKGTRMVVIAHYDNSANNPFNPDPKKDVAWGELTSEEMMLPWFGVVVNRDADPQTIASYRPGGLGDPGFVAPTVPPGPRLRLPTPPFAPNSSGVEIVQPTIFPGKGKLDRQAQPR